MSLLRSPQTLPNTWGIQWLLGAKWPARAGPTVAPLPLGISVDTGTLERVANWSPDSVATVDPCDPCSAFDATTKRLTRSSSDEVFSCKDRKPADVAGKRESETLCAISREESELPYRGASVRAPPTGRPTPELAGERPKQRWAPTQELDRYCAVF